MLAAVLRVPQGQCRHPHAVVRGVALAGVGLDMKRGRHHPPGNGGRDVALQALVVAHPEGPAGGERKAEVAEVADVPIRPVQRVERVRAPRLALEGPHAGGEDLLDELSTRDRVLGPQLRPRLREVGERAGRHR